jgi:hypothetical protein
MTKETNSAKDDKSVVKKLSNEEVREKIIQVVKFGGELDQSLSDLSETMAKFLDGNKQESSEAESKLKDKLDGIMMSLSNDTHWDLIETFNPAYRGLANELTSQLIKEYKCETHSEKALASLSANAYLRIIDNSKRLNNELGGPGTSISENKTKYLIMLSKQIDRAHRQFISSLTTLKQIKSPTIEMNIRTKNAFIAQNQQINSDYPPKSTKNENNESK